MLKGSYIRNIDGHTVKIADVRFESYGIVVDFAGACSALLKYKQSSDYWSGSCVVGSGYGQIQYRARLRNEKSGPQLFYLIAELGDEDLDFVGYSLATKLNPE